MNINFWVNKRVLITGHSGFKGSWLRTWLNVMGADVYGLSLHDGDGASWLFDGFDDHRSIQCDIRDVFHLNRCVKAVNPDVVFHLAAQALVSESYKNPASTFDTNVNGTINVLNSFQEADRLKVAVMITSDKCYQNKEWFWAYRETDELGGGDPYSASKAAMELAVQSWKYSNPLSKKIQVTTVRAGNVIGGGDATQGRIIPDCIRAWSQNQSVELRNPFATRPYQHVLEPLRGYLMTAEALWTGKNDGPFNLGPAIDEETTNKALCDIAFDWWTKEKGGQKNGYRIVTEAAFKEAHVLMLDSTKARKVLKWSPILKTSDSIQWSIEWYRHFDRFLKSKELATVSQWDLLHRGVVLDEKNRELKKTVTESALELTKSQIEQYMKLIKEKA